MKNVRIPSLYLYVFSFIFLFYTFLLPNHISSLAYAAQSAEWCKAKGTEITNKCAFSDKNKAKDCIIKEQALVINDCPYLKVSGCVETDQNNVKTDGTSLAPGEISCKEKSPDVYVGTGIFEGCSVNDPGKNDIICAVNAATDKVFLPVFGALVVVLVMITGIMYMTSLGASKGQLALAKKALTAVIVGLVVVLLSKWIVSYIDTLI